ncbi:MAG: sugar phosphate nucleotidyltransferase [Candidatus Uhrbacteria bacterium]
MKAIIMAGGTGTRLWPMSRESKPKQFFELVSDEPLILETYRRLLKFFPEEKIYFSVSEPLAEMLRAHFPDWPVERMIIEPEKRDTGPAMGFVAAILELDDPDEPIIFIPSDHFIGDEEKFLSCLSVGDQLIRETGKMLDIGVVPTFPSTVLGYTRIGELLEVREGVEIFNFAGHTEKPPYEIAKQYLEEGSYLWHASYYMWTPRKFMEAFENYAPEMATVLREIQQTLHHSPLREGFEGQTTTLPPSLGFGGTPPKASVGGAPLHHLYAKLPKTSFDYAVTEKMDPADVLIIKGDFGWSDIGAWDTLHDRLSTEENNNVTKGRSILIDTENSLIYAPEGKTVAVLGMKDIVVVDTGDALLVCPKSEAQRVKEIISQLKENNFHDVL